MCKDTPDRKLKKKTLTDKPVIWSKKKEKVQEFVRLKKGWSHGNVYGKEDGPSKVKNKDSTKVLTETEKEV